IGSGGVVADHITPESGQDGYRSEYAKRENQGLRSRVGAAETGKCTQHLAAGTAARRCRPRSPLHRWPGRGPAGPFFGHGPGGAPITDSSHLNSFSDGDSSVAAQVLSHGTAWMVPLL